MGSRFDSLDRRLDDMERKLDTVGKELDGMAKKMDSIMGKVDLLTLRQHELGVHHMAMVEKWLIDCSKRRR